MKNQIITQLDRFEQDYAEALVCMTYKVSRETIRSDTKSQDSVYARFAVWLVLRMKYSMTYAKIGFIYGRDHTTVCSGVKVAKSIHMDIDLGITPVDKSVNLVDNRRTVLGINRRSNKLSTVITRLSTGSKKQKKG